MAQWWWPVVRARVIDEMCASSTTLVLAATGVVETRGQNAAREHLLHLNVLPTLARLGVERLEIESRSANEDSRDTKSIRNWYRDQQAFRCPQLAFVGKTEPVAWLADAAAGLWADALLGRDSPIAKLVAAHRVAQATWL